MCSVDGPLVLVKVCLTSKQKIFLMNQTNFGPNQKKIYRPNLKSDRNKEKVEASSILGEEFMAKLNIFELGQQSLSGGGEG
jgi:hypothetical protein